MTDEIIAFKGEMMLLNWNESKQGRTAVFLLDEESPEHPFKQFTTKKGKKAGQRFMCVFVELNDDDTPVVQERKGGPLSKSAAQMCEYPPFQRFILERWDPNTPAPTDPVELAAAGIRLWCGVTSRAELDHDVLGAQLFQNLMREYRQWNAGDQMREAS